MIGIIAAMGLELEGLTASASETACTTIGGIDFVTGKLSGQDVVMAVSGVGKVNAALCAQTMMLRYAPSAIINTCIAGSLVPSLTVPDMAISTGFVQHDYDISPLGHTKATVLMGKETEEYPDGSLSTLLFPADEKLIDAIHQAAMESGIKTELGVIATGDCFVANSALKEELHTLYNAIACEMEGGAIAQVCRLWDIPFAAIRAISDTADAQIPFQPTKAAESSVKITRLALSKISF